MIKYTEIKDLKSDRTLAIFTELATTTKIEDVKKLLEQKNAKYNRYRTAFKNSKTGKNLSDSTQLGALDLAPGQQQTLCLYRRDLGPQISWRTVFLVEYTAPLLAYLGLYSRPAFIYGASVAVTQPHWSVAWLCACWSGHFVKRLLETLFVHKFSHATMPLRNLFKNCSFYFGFSVFVGYFTNHPLFTPAVFGAAQFYAGLAVFLFGELGNFSIHLALSQLRPAGTSVRRIPKPTANPFTWLFSLVSCPNYTYEVISWLGFTIMSQSLPSALFTLTGMLQMSIWAKDKHRAYLKEFSDYPRSRRAIIPFIY